MASLSSHDLENFGNYRKMSDSFGQYRKMSEQNWPGGRPPSMPVQGPPSPPRPTTPALPPGPEGLTDGSKTEDENEYVAPSFNPVRKLPENGSPTTANETGLPEIRTHNKPADKSHPPKIAFKPAIPSNKTHRQSPASPTSPTDDGIYHTVDEPTQRRPDMGPGEETELNAKSPTDEATNELKDNPFLSELRRKKTSQPIQGTGDNDRKKPAKPVIPPQQPTEIRPSPKKTDIPKYSGLRPGNNHGNSPPKVPPKNYPKPAKSIKPDGRIGKPELPDTPPVIPPPRPLKLAKIQSKPELTTGSEETSVSPKLRRENTAVAELGKLLSMKTPMSPSKLLKSTPQSPKCLQREGALSPAIPEDPVWKTEHSETSPALSKPSKPKETVRPSRPPPAKPAGSPRRSITSQNLSPPTSSPSRGTRRVNPTAVIIRRHAEGLSTSSVTSSDMIASALRPASKNTTRRPAKRPTVPPPPRPNVPPPPRPDSSAPQEKQKTPTGKSAPPSRPPPPSSEKIKAAEVRRQQLASKPSEEQEPDYNDMEFKHGEEFNPYAAIDDDAFDVTKSKIIQKPSTPSPPARNRYNQRLSSQSLGMIGNVKAILGKQKKGIDDARSTGMPSIVAGQSIYNGGDEEGVYAGIDDFDFPPAKHNNDVIVTSRQRTGRFV